MIRQVAPSPHEDRRPAPFLRLPNEVLAQIVCDHSVLTLPDLGRLCLVHSRLAPLSRRAAAKHPQRRYLHAILGRVPQDVLCIARANSEGQTGWLDLMAGGDEVGPGQLGKVWDAFGDGHDATVQHLVHLSDFLSLAASSLHRSNAGFAALCKGSLPTAHIPDATQRASHRLMLLFQSLLYSLVRSLTRRTRNVAGRSRESAEYCKLLGVTTLANASQRLEAQLQWEVDQLRCSLLRCDPLRGHGEEDAISSCACFSRSHASWYLLCFHFLTVRYRRFLTPEEVDHIAARSIYFSVPSFPASSSTASPAPASSGAFAWSFPLPGFTPSSPAAAPILPGPHGPPLLNPDSLLFSLSSSPTSQQTKEWFGLSEFALPASAARMWAGWLGFDWGQGGAYWEGGARREAEGGLRALRGGEAGGGGTLPVERVLLAHARWRARALRVQRGRLFAAAGGEQVGRSEEDEKRFAALLSRSAAFDWHFLSRAKQIQTWALRGWDGVEGDGDGGEGDGGAAHGQRLRGAVAASSPFQIVLAAGREGEGGASSSSRAAERIWRRAVNFLPRRQREAILARVEREDAHSRQLDAAKRWKAAWLAIEEPLLPFMVDQQREEEESSHGDGTEELGIAIRAAMEQEKRTLRLLGNLRHGLGAHDAEEALCNEDPLLRNPADEVVPAPSTPAKDTSAAGGERGVLHTWWGSTGHEARGIARPPLLLARARAPALTGLAATLITLWVAWQLRWLVE